MIYNLLTERGRGTTCIVLGSGLCWLWWVELTSSSTWLSCCPLPSMTAWNLAAVVTDRPEPDISQQRGAPGWRSTASHSAALAPIQLAWIFYSPECYCSLLPMEQDRRTSLFKGRSFRLTLEARGWWSMGLADRGTLGPHLKGSSWITFCLQTPSI